MNAGGPPRPSNVRFFKKYTAIELKEFDDDSLYSDHTFPEA